ncbi:hypothetical protein Ntsu_61750 [Nocardia sp. IFM 10818]
MHGGRGAERRRDGPDRDVDLDRFDRRGPETAQFAWRDEQWPIVAHPHGNEAVRVALGNGFRDADKLVEQAGMQAVGCFPSYLQSGFGSHSDSPFATEQKFSHTPSTKWHLTKEYVSYVVPQSI